ncbi:MAG: glutathione transferase GstA [Rhodospirillaceae bacterium]|nr:glutathione transferase GstA [Rhodospirillaceae bacterium]
MKLYFSPGACSLSPHIVLRELGLDFELEQVDVTTKRTKSGADYKAINPKGYVPALALDDGQILTETATIVQYLADKKPEKKLLPPAGTMERYRAQEWLNFIASEIHKGIGQLFNKAMPEEFRKVVKESLVPQRLDVLAARLDGRPFLLGDAFTAPDSYLFTVLNWTGAVGMDLGRWPTLKAYSERVAERPAVQAALKAEGLES